MMAMPFGGDMSAMFLTQLLTSFMQSGAFGHMGQQCPCHGQTGLYQPYMDMPYGPPQQFHQQFQSPYQQFQSPYPQFQQPHYHPPGHQHQHHHHHGPGHQHGPHHHHGPADKPGHHHHGPSDKPGHHHHHHEPGHAHSDKPQAPPKPPRQAPVHPKTQTKTYDPTKDAAELNKAMKGGIFGLGTDEDAIMKVLKGKTPEEIKALKENYKDHYGKDLMTHLEGELGGDDLKQAKAYLKGETSKGDAVKLRDALSGLTDDEEAVYETLKGKTAEQRAEIKDEYKKLTGKNLEDRLRSRLDSDEEDKALSLLEGNDAKADAASLRDALSGMTDDEDAVYSTLQGKSKEERAAIEKEYKDLTGQDLRSRMESRLDKDELSRATGLLDGNNAQADAAALHEAMSGWNDKKAIYATLEGKSPEERAAIKEAYKEKYGQSLDDRLKSELDGNNLEKAQSLLDKGQVSDAQALKHAMEGWGTDEDAIKKVLEGKSKEEIATLREDYKKETGRDLDADLKSELGGRDEFDAQMAMRGKAESVEEALERANEKRDFERKGLGNAISRTFMDAVNDKGELLDKNTDRANAQNEAYQKALSEGRYEDAQIEKQRLEQLLGYTGADVESYRESKDAAADAAGTVAATAASVAVVVATAGTATPLVATALAATAAGAGSRVATTAAISGNAYDAQDIGSDAAIGAVDGAATVLGAGAGRAATTALKGANSGLFRSRALLMGVEGAVDGTIGGALGGGAAEGLRDGAWDNGFKEGLQRVATGTAMGAAFGAVGGGGMGATIAGAPALARATATGGRKAAAFAGDVAGNLGDAGKRAWRAAGDLDSKARTAIHNAFKSGDSSNLTGKAKEWWANYKALDNKAKDGLRNAFGRLDTGNLGTKARQLWKSAGEFDANMRGKLKDAFKTGDGSNLTGKAKEWWANYKSLDEAGKKKLQDAFTGFDAKGTWNKLKDGWNRLQEWDKEFGKKMWGYGDDGGMGGLWGGHGDDAGGWGSIFRRQEPNATPRTGGVDGPTAPKPKPDAPANPRPKSEVPDAPPVRPGPDADPTTALRNKIDNFHDADILGRFRQVDGFDSLSPQQQLQALELADAYKPPKGIVDRMLGRTSTPEFQLEFTLKQMIRDGRITKVDGQGASVLDNLTTLHRQRLGPGINRTELMNDVVNTVGHPGTIKQGRRGTCAATSVQFIHAKNDPADFVRVMAGLTSESGEVSLRSGATMRVNATGIAADASNRDIADRIYQSSAMNHTSGRYDNNVIDPSGGRGGHVNPDGSFHYDGLTAPQKNKLLQDVTGRDHLTDYFSDNNSFARDLFEHRARGTLAEGNDMQVSMKWSASGEKHALHAVTVEGMDDEFVYLRNPWGIEDHTHGNPARELNGLGRARMKKSVFFDNLNSYDFTPGSVGERASARMSRSSDFFAQPGEIVDNNVWVPKARQRFPDLQVGHLDDADLRRFHGQFGNHYTRAEGSLRNGMDPSEAFADLDEFMRGYGYKDTPFSTNFLS